MKNESNMPNLTWSKVQHCDMFPNRKKNRIIGLCFPEQGKIVGLEPSILTVLPEGPNAEYSINNIYFNDNDVDYYACSVYISGYDEFKKWALHHDRRKIVVGGYHPSTFPEDFTRYAFKVVIGPCDDFFNTIHQEGTIVSGIVSNKKLPRYDLYNITKNQQVIPNKLPSDICSSINTSVGCPYDCNFCCTPIMTNRKLISKPFELLKRECSVISENHPKFLFIRDENFPLQQDWKERLTYISNSINSKIYLFASSNLLDEEKIKFMVANNVYMICLGLENINEQYNKNKHLDEICTLLHKHGIMVYLSFIVNPLEIVGQQRGKDFYTKLISIFHILKPEMVCGNFLMPFRGTKAWDTYYQYVSEEDYKHYNSKTAFLIRNKILREKMHFFMFYYQWLYYTSDFYNKNIRKFDCYDTLHLRFIDLYNEFSIKYQQNWNTRA